MKMHQLLFKQINSKHNIYVHVWDICFGGHEFDAFTILPNIT